MTQILNQGLVEGLGSWAWKYPAVLGQVVSPVPEIKEASYCQPGKPKGLGMGV